MNRESIYIAVALSLLGGCQSAARPPPVATNVPVVEDSVFTLDEKLGERAEPGEVETDQLIAATIAGYVERRYAEGRRPAMRDAHAKTHGCVRAAFAVDADLSGALRQGVFVSGKQYQAWTFDLTYGVQ